MATLTWWCPKHGTLQEADVLEGRDCRRCGQRAIPAPDVQRSEPELPEGDMRKRLHQAACDAMRLAVAECESVIAAALVRQLAKLGVAATPGRVIGLDNGQLILAEWLFRLSPDGPTAPADPEPGHAPGAN